ncbi:hypothetical protein NAI34_09280, partial [Francisella tularensis subsp. holarctica]|nr:hypothetical protein [Francisella tularensis subsp. holarctica]
QPRMVPAHVPLTATSLAETQKPLPDVKYIGIIMHQDSRMDQTIYNISYGGNEFKARQCYTDYKKTL